MYLKDYIQNKIIFLINFINTKYLIKTYTNEGETVLDNCIGSGTTAIACLQHKRNYIGSELSKEYIELSKQRLKPYEMQTTLF